MSLRSAAFSRLFLRRASVNFSPAAGWFAARHYHHANKATLSQAASDRADNITKEILAANWQDHARLALDWDFWDAEISRTEKLAFTYRDQQDVKEKLEKLRRLVNCMVVSTDVQDHIMELKIVITPSYEIPNINEHVSLVISKYDELKEEYPEFEKKIDECVGRAIAGLRSRLRFDWSSSHDFFY